MLWGIVSELKSGSPHKLGSPKEKQKNIPANRNDIAFYFWTYADFLTFGLITYLRTAKRSIAFSQNWRRKVRAT
jgi:hypothetical protein